MIYIVYPERRFVTDEQMATWFADAVANQEIHPDHLGAKTPEAMALALSDAGFITTAQPPTG